MVSIARQRRDAVHDLDLVAVRLGEPHPLAAAGLVDRLHLRRAGRLGQALEVILALRVIGQPDEFRLALLGDVDVVGRIGAAHVERGGGAVGAYHAEAREKFLGNVEIGRPQAAIGDVADFDVRHDRYPCSIGVGRVWRMLIPNSIP